MLTNSTTGKRFSLFKTRNANKKRKIEEISNDAKRQCVESFNSRYSLANSKKTSTDALSQLATTIVGGEARVNEQQEEYSWLEQHKLRFSSSQSLYKPHSAKVLNETGKLVPLALSVKELIDPRNLGKGWEGLSEENTHFLREFGNLIGVSGVQQSNLNITQQNILLHSAAVMAEGVDILKKLLPFIVSLVDPREVSGEEKAVDKVIMTLQRALELCAGEVKAQNALLNKGLRKRKGVQYWQNILQQRAKDFPLRCFSSERCKGIDVEALSSVVISLQSCKQADDNWYKQMTRDRELISEKVSRERTKNLGKTPPPSNKTDKKYSLPDNVFRKLTSEQRAIFQKSGLISDSALAKEYEQYTRTHAVVAHPKFKTAATKIDTLPKNS